jgi:DNA helicase-2/ATP-dependent DNA helicase PcrA
VSDLDGLQEEKGVSLMTLHSAKGLEFRAVIVAGLEDGLLPHFNSQGGKDDIEEERRLLYVGMTRAREKLYLSCCRRRRIAGRYQDQSESPFLQELPDHLIETKHSPELYYSNERHDTRTQGIYSFFNQSQGGRPPAQPPTTSSTTYGGRPPGSPMPGRPVPGAPAGRQVVPDPDAVPRRPIKRGSRVRHPTLGNGVILELEGQGDDARLTVFFEKAGKRKLVAKYANLEML